MGDLKSAAKDINGHPVTTTTLNSSDRLRKIDLLRERNIGKLLPLPQLVAVGDQSSGKSSLLESLTGIPFPRDHKLCTRYVTQITHRRDNHSHISITIIPGPNASEEARERFASYGKEVQSSAELRAQFSGILDEVNTLMGIRTSRNPTGNKTFTADVLKIEKCGPDEDYLTIIDVPGIFRLVEKGVVSESDKILVRNMVKEYIKDSRTVILAVLPATSDVFTQEILALAEEYDKNGERTLGVITKPDLLMEDRAKAAICDMVNGKTKPLNLGYYVVRNRGADDGEDLDAGDDSLAQRELIFREDPWCHLPKERLGVAALRDRLQDLLGQITDRCFPLVRLEARRMLAQSERAREELGEPRQTEREQQKYLSSIAGNFQTFARAALNADYSVHESFGSDEIRLITNVANITERFGWEFKNWAHVYSFEDEGDEESEDEDESSSSPQPPRAVDYEDLAPEEFPELDGILVVDWTQQQPNEGIMEWIERIYRRSRGLDLWTYSSGLSSSVFREQSVKWDLMTRQYLSKIILVLHRFVVRTLDSICTDEKVRDELKSSLMHDLLERYEIGMKQAVFLVSVEREKRPYTLTGDFHERVQESRGERIKNDLRYWKPAESVELWQVESTVKNKHNTDNTKEDIHDKLDAYYKVASKRFVDNVFRQAVDHCLLSGPTSPLLAFTEQWVIDLTAERLAAIAGEPRLVKENRDRLDKRIMDLKAAMKILQ
ncbi:putative dynamin [Apodospora peruviana]|uniref:Dynamin n=1 Tax=Apodospora peruviana TaxID=516989 RepID=A0AAE0HUY4_9PEZI|nr:putative dynamin [Apodospora peruviana]